MSFNAQFNPNMFLEPQYHQPILSGLSDHTQSQRSSIGSQGSSELAATNYSPSSDFMLAWPNPFNLIGFNPSDLMESAFKTLDNPIGPLEVEQPHPLSVEDDSNTAFLSTEQVKASPTNAKRKRSASFESADESSSSSPHLAKIFECVLDAECFEKFSRVEHLARHERKHTKEKPFECHCLKAFTRLDNWRQHKNTVHKHLVVENAKTEKSLVEVQKELRRMNKLRKATIMAATKQAKLDAIKQAERKPKAKKPSLAKSPIAIESTPLVSSALGGNDMSTLNNSALSNFTEFTPHHVNSSSLSDFSTSPFTIPLDISRVIPFDDMSQSLSSSAPQFSDFQALLEPFNFFAESQDPIRPFPSQSSMLPLTGVEVPNLPYQSNLNSGVLNQYHPVEYESL
ncbi:hypothetical protein DFH28DRAFT_1162499 [Melampsora americana]|nr:hypothetical protein DFH28DRAFT_1162499 [Melampsora americana]